jgi:hypothetical protein
VAANTADGIKPVNQEPGSAKQTTFLKRSIPFDQASGRPIAQQGLSKDGRRQIVEKKQTLGPEGRSASSLAVKREDCLGGDLPGQSEKCRYPMGRLTERQENLEFPRRGSNGTVR